MCPFTHAVGCIARAHCYQVHRPCLMGFFPAILKHLYDADIVEEEAMLMWAGEEGRSEEFTPAALTDDQVAILRKKAAPFITWLEEADEEDDEVVYDNYHPYAQLS